jgi:hypothetical protein
VAASEESDSASIPRQARQEPTATDSPTAALGQREATAIAMLPAARREPQTLVIAITATAFDS